MSISVSQGVVLVVAYAFSGFSVLATAPLSPDESSVHEHFSCKVESGGRVHLSVLRKDCVLEITESFSIPKEADQLLRLRNLGGDRIIRGPDDLRGCVEIESDLDAFEYLRLFSSVCTAHLFDEMQIEIKRSGADDCRGPCLSDERWAALGLFPPEAREGDGVFEVTRFIVVPIPNILHVSVRKIAERVYRDGRVVRVSTSSVEITQDDQIRLMFPIYM